jgi:hypothetical protein
MRYFFVILYLTYENWGIKREMILKYLQIKNEIIVEKYRRHKNKYE